MAATPEFSYEGHGSNQPGHVFGETTLRLPTSAVCASPAGVPPLEQTVQTLDFIELTGRRLSGTR
jgi:hypothetical protein